MIIVLVLIIPSGLSREENEDGQPDLTVADWLGHAIVSIIGLLLAITILITGAMLSGRLKRPERINLFKLHKSISTLFGFFMVGTFSYGLWITAQHGKPLLSSVHGWLGLTIATIAVIQLVPSLVIKTRTKIKIPHMIFGYTLVFLVVLEVTWGLHIAVLGSVKPLVLIHSTSGAIAAFALAWIVVEMRYLTEKGIGRARIASYIAAFSNTAGCWLVGGYNYLVDYGANVRPILRSGPQPWAHLIIMETKEHVFLFLPIISILLAITLFALGRDDTLLKDSKSKRAVILIAAFALFFVLLMFVMGALISNAGNIRVGE